MIAVYCDRCGEELTEPGALEISPPTANGVCVKTHVCVKCWKMGPIEKIVQEQVRNGALEILKKQRDELAGLLRDWRKLDRPDRYHMGTLNEATDIALAGIKP